MGITQEEKATLLSLARGAAMERFDDEFQKILNNVVDPNSGDGARKVTLTVTLKPNKERTMADLLIDCKGTVQPPKAVPTVVFIGKDRGQGICFEHDPKQMQIYLDATKPAPQVLEGGKGKEAMNA